MKSKIVWTAIAIAAVGIATALITNMYRNRIAVLPGLVTGSSPLAYKIGGTYEGIYSLRGEKGGTLGGACMIFQDPNNKRACASDATCAVQNGHGYCVIEEGAGTCWFRPDPDADHCKRGLPLPAKYSLGPANPYPQVVLNGPLDPAQPYGSDHALWRVLTCQGLLPNDPAIPRGCNNDAAVQGIGKLYRYGPVAEFENRPPRDEENSPLKPPPGG